MDNEALKEKYNEMHKKGPESWFSDGVEERYTIFEVGYPCKGKTVLEIGCGEGHLAATIAAAKADYVVALDYSEEAIKKAEIRYCLENMMFMNAPYRGLPGTLKKFDTIVMQGVLEHLDKPWLELKWMKDHLLDFDHWEIGKEPSIVTSSPCFCNPRGFIWMALATLFNVPMSLTDLHFLHPWEFQKFAADNNLKAVMKFCDLSWGTGPDMVADFKDRLPKALADAGMMDNRTDQKRIKKFLKFLSAWTRNVDWRDSLGATAVYKFTKKGQHEMP